MVKGTKASFLLEVQFEAPGVDSLYKLSKVIKGDVEDEFLLAGATIRGNGECSGIAIPKTVLERIMTNSRTIATELDKVTIRPADYAVDSEMVVHFQEAMVEMYNVADLAESMLYAIITPYLIPLIEMTEYKEASAFLFDCHASILGRGLETIYNKLIDDLDRVTLL